MKTVRRSAAKKSSKVEVITRVQDIGKHEPHMQEVQPAAETPIQKQELPPPRDPRRPPLAA